MLTMRVYCLSNAMHTDNAQFHRKSHGREIINLRWTLIIGYTIFTPAATATATTTTIVNKTLSDDETR